MPKSSRGCNGPLEKSRILLQRQPMQRATTKSTWSPTTIRWANQGQIRFISRGLHRHHTNIQHLLHFCAQTKALRRSHQHHCQRLIRSASPGQPSLFTGYTRAVLDTPSLPQISLSIPPFCCTSIPHSVCLESGGAIHSYYNRQPLV